MMIDTKHQVFVREKLEREENLEGEYQICPLEGRTIIRGGSVIMRGKFAVIERERLKDAFFAIFVSRHNFCSFCCCFVAAVNNSRGVSKITGKGFCLELRP